VRLTAAADRVIFWDFDATLGERPGHWRGAVRDALTEVLGEHEFSVEQIAAELMSGFPWHQPEIPHPQLSRADDWWAHLAAVLARAVGRLGIPPGPAAEAAGRVRYQFIDPASWRLFDDTLAALDQLAGLGWRHVVVSNHVPELPAILASLGLADYFADVVNSAVTGYEKPHPMAFLIAMERAGQPQRAWMIGDNPVADVAGAAAVGLPAILVRTRPPDGGRHITSLAEVAELVSADAASRDGVLPDGHANEPGAGLGRT
jgi:putative hydrolase of the HAD superfamily